MKKLLAILLACSLMLGIGVGCSNGDKEHGKEEDKQEQSGGDNQGDNEGEGNNQEENEQEERKNLTAQEWFTAFKNTVDSLCVTDYAFVKDAEEPLFQWKDAGTIPNDKNCKVTMTGADGKMMAQVVVAEGTAFLELYFGVNYQGDEDDRPIIYLKNAADGKMTGYQCGQGEAWGRLTVNHAEEWAQSGLFGATSPLDYLLGMGLIGQLNETESSDGEAPADFKTYFAYSEEKGGWVSKTKEIASMATGDRLDGEIVYKIKGDKIVEIVLTGICPELGLETSGSVVYSFVYGGQKVEVPPEVIEAAKK